MDINQARRNEFACGVDDGFGMFFESADIGYSAVDNKNVAFLINAVRRVYNSAIFYKDFVAHKL
jgi:hypothetical protein